MAGDPVIKGPIWQLAPSGNRGMPLAAEGGLPLKRRLAAPCLHAETRWRFSRVLPAYWELGHFGKEHRPARGRTGHLMAAPLMREISAITKALCFCCAAQTADLTGGEP